MRSRSNCTTVSTSYVASDGYYGDVIKKEPAPRRDVSTDAATTVAESMFQQPSAATDGMTTAVAMLTSSAIAIREDEGS